MISLSDFSIGENKRVYLFKRAHDYSVRCHGYRSRLYDGPYSLSDYSDFSYTLVAGDFRLCFELYLDEIHYLSRLYGDGLD